MNTLVLSLHIEGTVIPISGICEVSYAIMSTRFILVVMMPVQFLKISATRLNALAREIGCSINKSADGGGTGEVTYTAQIQLPLKFPEGRSGRKSRG